MGAEFDLETTIARLRRARDASHDAVVLSQVLINQTYALMARTDELLRGQRQARADAQRAPPAGDRAK
jgi:hypothetical protein